MSERTMLQMFELRARSQADDIAFAEFSGARRAWTWAEWQHDARAFAAALIESGGAPGDVIAILAGNTPVWPIADIGALMAGCVTVGVYPSSPAVQVHEILNDCAARVVVVDGVEQLAKVLEVRSALPNLRTIVCDDGGALEGVQTLRAWLESGRTHLPRLTEVIAERSADTRMDDVAILIYTSGSTGRPKGARISHRYIASSAEAIADTLDLTENDSMLSFLPFSHAAERIFGLYTRIQAGMHATMVQDHTQVWAAARECQPTLFGGLPRFYEKIFEALQARYASLSENERQAWDEAIALGRTRSDIVRRGAHVSADLEAAWRHSIAPARAVIENMIGTRVEVATSGGATLPKEVAEYLAASGLTVLGAYGMTEHLCTAMHRPHAYDFDTVGPPMPGTELRIAEHGEIQMRRSALTFSGYLNNPEETRAAFTEDGEWLRSGDIGHIDEAGHLRVTGRLKELIALSGGKKVAPAPIERQLTESAWISQAVLFGESRKYLSALIALRREVIEEWARAQDLDCAYEDLLRNPVVVAAVQAEVDRVNARVSRPEQVRRFALLPDELNADRNELTPTLKVKRSVVAERYRETLEALYQ